MGWNRSTLPTLFRRMEAKGTVVSDSMDDKKMFRTAVSREDVAIKETEDFLSRVYKGCLRFMVSSMTKKQALSKRDR